MKNKPKTCNINLTLYESRCLFDLLDGNSIAEIATTFKLSPHTVGFYLKNIRQKLTGRKKLGLTDEPDEGVFKENFQISKGG